MGRISLRTYNNEIEKLIEQESFEEAIAHCRHILSIFPKHVDTYRLLGKAYLESHKHTEALDIFQRLLSAIPDDFIAHLAMSIIREEEGNLDAAIGHMTYAFEIQPYNNAIQEEMRRLYARRDGAAPAKIRLTHGALARMYMRGNLYEQALAEIRQVLANNPRRADMQLLLAQVYEKLNKPVQTAEICSLLLKKLPYCLEANRILANIITVSKGKKEAEVYYTHLEALDPYRAFINPQAPTLSDIPDQAVQLEKLVYQPGGLVPTAQEDTWLASIGEDESALALSQEEELPDWLTGEGEESPAKQTPTETSTREDVIPDWMKEAGWGPDSGAFDEAAASKSILAEDVDEGESIAAPAELPDWLQEIAPPEVVTGGLNLPPDEAAAEEDETLAALIDTGSLNYTPEAPAEASPAEELPDWLSELEAEEAAPAEITAAPAEASPAEEVPDWLSELEAEEAAPAAEISAEPAEASPAEEVPDWLSELEAEEAAPAAEISAEPVEAAPAEEVPDWLSELGAEEAAPAAEISEKAAEAAEPGEGKAVAPAQPAAELEAPPDFEDMDAAMAWLEGLAAKQGASEEELLTSPEARPTEAPEWVQEISEEAEETPEPTAEAPEEAAEPTAEVTAEPIEAAPAEELPDWLSELGTEEAAPTAQAEEAPAPVAETPGEGEAVTPAQPAAELEAPPDFEDMDAAMAWLEGLAAKQGASEEELLTSPEARPTEAPEWVQEISEEAEETPEPTAEAPEEAAEPTAEVTAEPVEAAPAEEVPDWLSELGAEEAAPTAEPTEAPAEAAPAEELPDWLSELGAEEAAPAAKAAAEPAEAAPAEELPDWLSELGAEEAAPTAQAEEAPAPAAETPGEGEAVTPAQPEAALEAPPDFEDMDAAMAWLEGLAAKQGASEEELLTSPEARPTEAPEWVQEISEETAGEAEEAAEPTAEVTAAPAEAAPAEEVPDWLSELEAEEAAPAAEISEKAAEAAEPGEGEAVAPAQPAAELEAPPDFEDMDAAMAWLEGLAAKQGASEEELLTSPEARPTEAPEWVQEISEEAEETPEPTAEAPEEAAEPTAEVTAEPAEAAPAEEELPDWLSESGAEEAAPAAEATAEPAEVAPAEALPDWLSKLEAEEAVTPAQPEARSTPSFEESPTGTLPPPPDWVLEEETPKEAFAAEEQAPETPPSASEEVPLPPPPEWVLEGEAPQEEAATTPISWDKDGQASIEKIDLNQASLVQLERLPGIGFRLAQAIVTYRDAHGPFISLEDLESVAGIGPMTIAELRNFLYIVPPSEKKHRRPPTGMPLPDAQSALEADSPEEAVRILQPVIRSGGALDEVIHLLRQALYKYPDSFELWQTLGDACVRADRLDEALEAYDQAEQILVQIT